MWLAVGVTDALAVSLRAAGGGAGCTGAGAGRLGAATSGGTGSVMAIRAGRGDGGTCRVRSVGALEERVNSGSLARVGKLQDISR